MKKLKIKNLKRRRLLTKGPRLKLRKAAKLKSHKYKFKLRISLISHYPKKVNKVVTLVILTRSSIMSF